MTTDNPLTIGGVMQQQAAHRGDLPEGATDGPYKIGAMIMVSRDSIAEIVRNPDLPEWFPAQVIMPPENEPGNWYRWYDPFIWYETEIDLSNGGEWCTEKRNQAYTGKLWYDAEWCREWWAKPVEVGS